MLARASKIVYEKYPPKILFCSEKAKSDVAAAGPSARCVETIVCARPFMAPREHLFGAAEETNTNTEPDARNIVNLDTQSLLRQKATH